jgi:hypothetical protein
MIEPVLSGARANYLLRMAPRYIWWKAPEDAVKYPQRLLAQIMNMGTWDDLCELILLFTKEELINVLHKAEAGQFNARSWHFWHYKLTDCEIGGVPQLPKRFIPPKGYINENLQATP